MFSHLKIVPLKNAGVRAWPVLHFFNYWLWTIIKTEFAIFISLMPACTDILKACWNNIFQNQKAKDLKNQFVASGTWVLHCVFNDEPTLTLILFMAMSILFLYAFICLNSEYYCKFSRVGRTRIPRNAVSRLPALFHKIKVNLWTWCSIAFNYHSWETTA